jgi:long-chain fatty acid transport protein
VEYTRLLHRNASTDVDAAFYNPAGLVWLPSNGLFFQVGNQFIFQNKTIEDDAIPASYGLTYEGDIQALMFPTLAIAYKMDALVAFFHFGPIGGGGGGTFDNGLPLFDGMILDLLGTPGTYTRDLSFEGTVFNLGATLGGAYQINEMFSVALGYRLTYATRTYNGELANLVVDGAPVAVDTEVEIEADGYGHSLVLGANAKINSQINVGFKFEYNWILETENTSTYSGAGAALFGSMLNNTSFGDGVKNKITEPMLFALGVSYQITPELRVEPGLMVEVYKWTDLDGAEDERNTKFFLGLGVEYRVMQGLLVSVGWAWENSSRTEAGQDELDYSLPCNHFAIGARYTVIPNLDVTAGFVYSLYMDQTSTEVSVLGGEHTYSTDSIAVGIGVTYALPM